jgi:hypothetical protein
MMANSLRVIDTEYQGDPFLTLVECDGKYYVINEAALIADQERMYRSFEMDLRLKAADSLRSLGIPW